MAKKGIRKQLFSAVAERWAIAENNNNLSIFDLLRGCEGMKVSELNDVIEGELDARCGNGHFSRWTSFGQSLYRDFKRFERILEAEYKKIGLALS